MKKYLYLLVLCASVFLTHAVTIVYNMRIAEITKRQKLNLSNQNRNILAQTSFGQVRTLKNGFKQRAFGAIASYIRAQESVYLKIDGAYGHVQNNILTRTVKRTQTDDILFTGGYSHTGPMHSFLRS